MIGNEKERKRGEYAGKTGGVLFTPAFTALLVAQLFSLTGSSVARFVLPLHLLNLTGSASLYGAATAAAFVPYILCMPVGGVVADRLRKQWLMAGIDALLALATAAYLLFSSAVDIVALTLVVLMVLFACQAFDQPAIQASVPYLVERGRVTQAVAIMNQANMLTSILGPVLGGAVFGFFDVGPIMALATASFAMSSALLAAFVKMDDGRATSSVEDGNCPAGQLRLSPFAVFVADLQAAAVFLRSKPLLWHAIAFAACCNFVLSAGLTVGGAYIVTERLGLSNQLMGIAEASYGVGGLLGGLVVTVRPQAFPFTRIPTTLLFASLGLVPMATALALNLPSLAVFAIMLACLAWILGCATCFTIALTGTLQTETPSGLIGKVMALMYAAVNCATPLGQLVFGLAFDIAVPVVIVAVMCATMLVLSLLMCADFKREANKNGRASY